MAVSAIINYINILSFLFTISIKIDVLLHNIFSYYLLLNIKKIDNQIFIEYNFSF